MSVHDKALNVLLIEDNSGDVALVRRFLAEAPGLPTSLEVAGSLSDGLKHLAKGGIDILMLDLGLPDSEGLETFEKALARAPAVPIVVYTALADDLVGLEAIQKGAQDYVVKVPSLNSKALTRILRYAVERKRSQGAFAHLALTDELTQLHNRRGFLAVAQNWLKFAERTRAELDLYYIDVDGLKLVNDNLGHGQGDCVLVDAANVLKRTFRGSDVIARIGGDEFAVLAIVPGESTAGTLAARLEKNLEALNASEERPYKISVSIGVARCAPGSSCLIDDLLRRADESMYEQKRGKRRR